MVSLHVPCMLGKPVYLVDEHFETGLYVVVDSIAISFKITQKHQMVSCYVDCPEIGNTVEYEFKDFGETIFACRNDAERIAEYNNARIAAYRNDMA